MPTKDPHIAVIDAHDEMERIKLRVKQAVALFKTKATNGTLTEDDLAVIKKIRQAAIDATRRVHDELAEELESHERHGHLN